MSRERERDVYIPTDMDKNKRTLSFQDLGKNSHCFHCFPIGLNSSFIANKTVSPAESRYLVHHAVSGTTSPQDWRKAIDEYDDQQQSRRRELLYSLMSQYLSRGIYGYIYICRRVCCPSFSRLLIFLYTHLFLANAF